MSNSSNFWYVYIIRDKLNRLYTGISNDVLKRYCAHKEGRGSKFLKGMQPIELVYCSEPLGKIEAAQYEYKIKKLTKKTKEQIILNKTDISQFFK
ncbi:GIY-YIG nuclease family protein [Thorsellia kenyensis]|uniref:GIY-YIG nuclease family protein n=1 Tax=Thorsellia kenyensis TaxID=1549888 RepID=A0ABV6CEU8_9GAMM